MEPQFFSTPSDFRTWLENNHQAEAELLVGFYKVNSGKPSMSWSESVDQGHLFRLDRRGKKICRRGKLYHPIHTPKERQHLERYQH